jgi:hypothetical protein
MVQRSASKHNARPALKRQASSQFRPLARGMLAFRAADQKVVRCWIIAAIRKAITAMTIAGLAPWQLNLPAPVTYKTMPLNKLDATMFSRISLGC